MTGQSWEPGRYMRNAGFVPELGGPVVDLLDPRPGERILDLGCGNGVLTEKIIAAGARVVGVDASAEQIAEARRRGLDAHVMNGASLTFDGEFDAVFSNAALHWMQDADAVIAGVCRALRPGGRFVGEMGGDGNVAAISSALIAALEDRGLDGKSAFPWYFPTPEAYSEKLTSAGFKVDQIELIPRPTPLPGDLVGWLETFAESFINLVPIADRPDFFSDVKNALSPLLSDDNGVWVADYVRLRFHATRNDG